MENWSGGELEWWWIGVVVDWSDGELEWWRIGVMEFWSGGIVRSYHSVLLLLYSISPLPRRLLDKC